MRQAFLHYQQALAIFTREAYPDDWARIQSCLDAAYPLQKIIEKLSQPAKNPDEMPGRIDMCHQALMQVSRNDDPTLWASMHNELAISLAKNPLGSRADNLDQAIIHFRKALEVFTQNAHPHDWAGNQCNLGNVYADHLRGDRADNIEEAIVCYKESLKVYTRDLFPSAWASTQDHLGVAYRQRIRGDRTENLEEAIAHALQALSVRTRDNSPESWAAVHHSLANAYCERIQGDPADNLEKAIAYIKLALTVRTREAHPEDWAASHNTLAIAYIKRHEGDPADNLEQAIAHSELALQVFNLDIGSSSWAEIQNSLAVSYTKRVCGDRSNNLKKAITHYQQALRVYTKDTFPLAWARIQNNLANLYCEQVRFNPYGDREEAIAHYKRALQVRTLLQSPLDFQETQINLGHLHFEREEWADACKAYQEAIEAEKTLLLSAYTQTGQLAVVAKTGALYASSAYALLNLGRWGEALVLLEQGKTRLLSRALALNELDLNVLPNDQRETLRGLRQTIRLFEAEMHMSVDTQKDENKRTIANALESTRARLNQTVQTTRKAYPDFMPEGITLAELLVLIPQDAVLVAPIVTSHGSAVFVVPAGAQSVTVDHLIWVADFKQADVEMLIRGSTEQEGLGGWLGGYFNAGSNRNAWITTIENIGQILWDRLMFAVNEKISKLPVRQVLLMPQGGLGLLPLHAAWHEIDSKRRYFLDDYTVSYVPSAYALRVSQNRVRDAQSPTRTLFAVINPTNDLPFAPAEGEQVARCFDETNFTLFSGKNATVDAVKHGGASYLHFACHGFYSWLDPLQSGLILANGEPLTLAQILGNLSLDATRLVTLSACETGITDIRQSPDEYIGLPAGFLQAGAPAVVSTLWPVNDRSTMLLMEHFYQLHLKERLDIPTALCKAQMWLRDVTIGELEERFAAEEDRALDVSRMPLEIASDYFTTFATLAAHHGKKYQPFAHPYYWAAFTFSGA